MGAKIEYKKIDAVIKANIGLFKKPGVISVRPGYKWICGQLVDKPCIVVTVTKKNNSLKSKDKLPLSVGDFLVDVTEATPMEKLRANDPDSFKLIQEQGPGEWKQPEHPFERSIPDGNLLPLSRTAPALKATNKIPYSAPNGEPLKLFKGKMTITANASPDGGYKVLSDFLAQTSKSLTVGMYSFTSASLLKDMVDAVKPGAIDFTMVLDGPPTGTTHPDQTDSVTRDTILTSDANAKINWALETSNIGHGRVKKAIFPTAYHIKVAVKDSSSFWLSSGNFNDSNQPNITPAQQKGPFDRDWHVVIDNKPLAQLFEAYIKNDFSVAGQQQDTAEEAAAALAKAAAAKMKQAMNKLKTVGGANKVIDESFPGPVSTLGQGKVFSNVTVSVQPVLTPDDGENGKQYIEQIIGLIDSAVQTLDMQFQYIAAYDKSKEPAYTKLLEAVQRAIDRNVTVRIITSQFENKWRPSIIAAGFDAINDAIRIQNRVHNKGIIVDTKKVLISSQNWSSQGVLENRDAGVIIEHDGIAAYFAAIFDEDYKLRTIKTLSTAKTSTKSAAEGQIKMV